MRTCICTPLCPFPCWPNNVFYFAVYNDLCYGLSRVSPSSSPLRCIPNTSHSLSPALSKKSHPHHRLCKFTNTPICCLPWISRRGPPHTLSSAALGSTGSSTMTCATVSYESHPHPRPSDVYKHPPIPVPCFYMNLTPIPLSPLMCTYTKTPICRPHLYPDGGPLAYSRVPPLGARARPP